MSTPNLVHETRGDEGLEPPPSFDPSQVPQKRKLARQLSSVFVRSSMDEGFKDRIRPTLILGFMYFKKPINVANTKKLFYDRIVIPQVRFRSKAVLDQGNNDSVYFEELPIKNLDMNYHVQEKESSGWDEKDIDVFLSDIYTKDMDPSKPLWVLYILNNLKDGRSCMILNLDHAIGDGISLTQMLLTSMIDKPSELPDGKVTETAESIKKPKIKGKQYNMLSIWDKVYYFCSGVITPFIDPVLSGDNPNGLKMKDHRRPGMEKRGRFAESLSLDKVKEVKSKFRGATVNDILTAVLNMAVRRFFEAEKDPILEQRNALVRANFPINMRKQRVVDPNSHVVRVGNRFSTGSFTFDLQYKSRIDLVWSVKRQIDAIKISPRPVIEQELVNFLIPRLPKEALLCTLLDTFGKYTMMLSNVPGPGTLAHFGGEEIDDIAFYCFNSLGTYCGICSYNGKVSMSVCCDRSVLEDPGRLARYWKEEFDALYSEVMSYPDTVLVPPKKNTVSIAVVLVALLFAAPVLLSLFARMNKPFFANFF